MGAALLTPILSSIAGSFVSSVVGNLLGGGDKKATAPSAPTTTPAQDATKTATTPTQAVDNTRSAAALANSRAKSVLTDPLGLSDTQNNRPTLLGA